jgi:hypothetical protein
VHALSILSRVLKDQDLAPALDYGKTLNPKMFGDAVATHGSAVFDYASQWTIDVENPGEIDRKIEELHWLYTVIYAAAGHKCKAEGFSAKFQL